MFSCPYCQHPLPEDAPACPTCRLSVDNATALLGPVPLLNRGITDTTETLSKRDRARLEKARKDFERHHPPSGLNIVLRACDPAFPLSTHLFWLFNSTGLSPLESQGEKNQDLLLLLDPTTHRCALMVGYGLEPFFSQDVILNLLEKGRPLLEDQEPAKALLVIIKELSHLLQRALQDTQAIAQRGSPE